MKKRECEEIDVMVEKEMYLDMSRWIIILIYVFKINWINNVISEGSGILFVMGVVMIRFIIFNKIWNNI